MPKHRGRVEIEIDRQVLAIFEAMDAVRTESGWDPGMLLQLAHAAEFLLRHRPHPISEG